MFVPGKPLQPSLLFAGKAKSLPKMGTSFRCSSWVGSSPSHKHKHHKGWRDLPVTNTQHSSLLRTFVNYGRETFHNIGRRSHFFKENFENGLFHYCKQI